MESKMAHHQDHQHLSHRIVKTTTAFTVGGSSMVLSSLALAATVMGLVVATPLMLIFSPVLVPAVAAVSLITGGFLATGGFCATATYMFYWMYKYVTGKHPAGEGNLDHLRHKIGGGVAEITGRAEDLGQEIANKSSQEQQQQHGEGGLQPLDEQKGEQEQSVQQQKGGQEQTGHPQPQIKGTQEESGQPQPPQQQKQSKSGKKKQQNKGGQDTS